MGWNHIDQWGPILRSEVIPVGYNAEQNNMMEKRQLFLRSYQFSRKRSVAERIKRSLVKVKRLIWFRLRSARKFRKLVWSRLRYALSYKRRRFLRLLNNNKTSHDDHKSSGCLW